MGRAHRNLRERIMRARQPVAGGGVHIAVFDLDLGAQPPEHLDEQIHRPRADGAAARQRDARLAHARKKRADHPEAGAHFRDQFIGRGDVDNVARGEIDRAGEVLPLGATPALHRIVDAMIGQDPDQLLHIGQMRHVFQRQRVVGQKRGDHQRQGRVLGAGNRNDAVERVAADDANAVHQEKSPLFGAPAPAGPCGPRHRRRLDDDLGRFKASPGPLHAADCGLGNSSLPHRQGEAPVWPARVEGRVNARLIARTVFERLARAAGGTARGHGPKEPVAPHAGRPARPRPAPVPSRARSGSDRSGIPRPAASVGLGLAVIAGGRRLQPFIARIGRAGPARARLGLSLLQIGAQRGGQPFLARPGAFGLGLSRHRCACAGPRRPPLSPQRPPPPISPGAATDALIRHIGCGTSRPSREPPKMLL